MLRSASFLLGTLLAVSACRTAPEESACGVVDETPGDQTDGKATLCCSPVAEGETAAATPESSPTNILLIVMDDIGPELVGAYGVQDEAPPTPSIDALAAQGVMFEHAWANPWCSPTRATMMTGRHARRYGIGRAIEPFTERTVLPLSELTLPQLIARDSPWDYRLGMIGKWHLTSEQAGAGAPLDYGFEHFSGTFANLDSHHAFDGKVMTYFDWEHVEEDEVNRRKGYVTSATVDDALAWTQAQTGPWFAWVAFHSGHTPLHGPPESLQTYGNVTRASAAVQIRAMVEAMDTEIGRLLAGLGPEVLANTHVIVLGDNGTSNQVGLGAFEGALGKSTVVEHGVRVPLIITGPAVARPGARVGAVVQTTDLFRTIAELAGVDTSDVGVELDSVSLLPYLRDPDYPARRRWIYAEAFTPNNDDDRGVADERAATDGRYKLSLRNDRLAFYDLGDALLEGTALTTLSAAERQARDTLSEVLDRAGGPLAGQARQ